MSKQETTGWGIIILAILLLWWLSKNALGFLHGTTVQSTMITGDTQQANVPTMTCDTCA